MLKFSDPQNTDASTIILWLVTLAFAAGLMFGCKPQSTENQRSAAANSSAANQLPTPIVSERSESELRAAFAELAEKYRKISASEFYKTATARALAPRRKLRTLNIQLRDPIANISKTAKLSGSSNLGAPIRATGGVIRKEIASANIVNVEFPDASDEKYLAAVIDFLKSDARIEIVEPDYLVSKNLVPNDPSYSRLWGLQNNTTGIDLKAQSSWDYTTGKANTIIAVIDSGIDCTHEDLIDNCWTNPGESGTDSRGRSKSSNGVDDDGNGYIDDWQGWNFVANTNRPMDDNGHGTHVAGTIAATGNNAKGVTGVTWRASLVPLKFLDANGDGYLSDVIAAIDYATSIKAFASNNSWGGGGYSFLTSLAIERANRIGSLFIAAAGNEQNNNDVVSAYPGNYSWGNVVSVAAIDRNGNLSWFSNYGATKVDLAAPGEGIYSTMPGNSYGSLSGTSMAAPHVTGALALLHAYFVDMPPNQLVSLFMNNVTPRATLTGKVMTGGFANTYAAINAGPDIEPPSAPSEITVSDRGLNFASISWQPSGDDGMRGTATRYELRIATEKIDSDAKWNQATTVPIASNTTTNGKFSAVLSDLPAGFSGWVAMRAWDESNNVSDISDSVSLTLVPLARISYYDGASQTIPDEKSSWVIENDTQRGAVFSDGVGSYAPNSVKRMTLPAVPLQLVQNLAIRFWTSSSLEQDKDRGSILISHADQTREEWIEVGSVTGKSNWRQKTLDLTTAASRIVAAGHNEILIHFELQADAAVQYEGWLLDDIEVLGNTKMIQITGVPPKITRQSEYQIQFNAPTGTTYTSSIYYGKGGAKDCSATESYNQAALEIDARIPLDGVVSTPGNVFLCLKFNVPGYLGAISTFANWNLVTSRPEIKITDGLPEARSNKNQLTLKTVADPVDSVTAVSMMILSSASPIPDDACSNPNNGSIQTNGWSDWYSIGDVTIGIPPGDGYRKLCARGRDDTGVLQENPFTHTWYADFTAPLMKISKAPPTLNRLASFKVEISAENDRDGTQDATSCKATVVSGPGNCPQSQISYGPCSMHPAEFTVNVITDGPHTLCVLGIDQAGNISPTPIKFSWSRDTTIQPIEFTRLPSNPSATSRLNIGITAKESGKYRYLLNRGRECPTNQLLARPEIEISTPITDTLPLADDTFTLCASFTDMAGNQQEQPTVYTWTKDTWPPVALVANPPPASNATNQLSLKISGDGVTEYQWGLKSQPNNAGSGSIPPASACLVTSYSEFFSVNRDLQLNIESLGQKTLCLRGRDAAGNLQRSPTFLQWTQVNSNVDERVPMVALREGSPFNPTAKTWWNITADTSGDRSSLASWRYALLASRDHSCVASATNPLPWGAWQPITAKIEINDTSPDGFRTLCFEGRNAAGRTQDTPTVIRWIKVREAPLVQQTTTFGTLTRTSSANLTESFSITRLNPESVTRNIPVLMCPADDSSGRLMSCKKKFVTFPSNAATGSVSYNNIYPGNWVVLPLPQPGRGRVEPLLFRK